MPPRRGRYFSCECYSRSLYSAQLLERRERCFCLLLFVDPTTARIYTLSLHDALPISIGSTSVGCSGFQESFDQYRRLGSRKTTGSSEARSEEHTSELQSRRDLVCRLLLEKKKIDLVSNCQACVLRIRLFSCLHDVVDIFHASAIAGAYTRHSC